MIVSGEGGLGDIGGLRTKRALGWADVVFVVLPEAGAKNRARKIVWHGATSVKAVTNSAPAAGEVLERTASCTHAGEQQTAWRGLVPEVRLTMQRNLALDDAPAYEPIIAARVRKLSPEALTLPKKPRLAARNASRSPLSRKINVTNCFRVS